MLPEVAENCHLFLSLSQLIYPWGLDKLGPSAQTICQPHPGFPCCDGVITQMLIWEALDGYDLERDRN
jgi:hypothetical protein